MTSAMNARITARTWRRWLADESGQDIIEYALLCSFLGFSAAVGVGLLRTAMNNTYTAWDAAGQTDALVEMPDPK